MTLNMSISKIALRNAIINNACARAPPTALTHPSELNAFKRVSKRGNKNVANVNSKASKKKTSKNVKKSSNKSSNKGRSKSKPVNNGGVKN